MAEKMTNVQVKVTYIVGLGDDSIPDIVKQQLKELHEDDIELDGMDDREYPDAVCWLNKNVKERNCFDIEYKIEEFYE